MTDEEHSATSTLKRISPFWAWFRKSWPVLASVGGTSVVWLIVQSFSVGAYREKIDQMDKHMESIDKKAEGEKNTLDRVEGMDRRLERVEDWRDGIRRDVQDANQVKVPKLTAGHRAHKP